MFLLMLTTSAAFADVSGGIGYDSDYFFRGVSQTNGGTSTSAWLDWNNDQGVYVGAWAGQVDFKDDASLESNLYLGYGSNLTDNLSYDTGIVQYRYNHGYDNIQEAFVGLNYGNVNLYHYVDTESWNDYTQISYNLWFIPLVEASVSYGYQSREVDHFELNFDYTIAVPGRQGGYILGLDVMEEVLDGNYKLANTIAVGLSYNF